MTPVTLLIMCGEHCALILIFFRQFTVLKPQPCDTEQGFPHHVEVEPQGRATQVSRDFLALAPAPGRSSLVGVWEVPFMVEMETLLAGRSQPVVAAWVSKRIRC